MIRFFETFSAETIDLERHVESLENHLEFKQLPMNVLQEILSHLDNKDLFQVISCSKFLKKRLKSEENDDFWRCRLQQQQPYCHIENWNTIRLYTLWKKWQAATSPGDIYGVVRKRFYHATEYLCFYNKEPKVKFGYRRANYKPLTYLTCLHIFPTNDYLPSKKWRRYHWMEYAQNYRGYQTLRTKFKIQAFFVMVDNKYESYFPFENLREKHDLSNVLWIVYDNGMTGVQFTMTLVDERYTRLCYELFPEDAVESWRRKNGIYKKTAPPLARDTPKRFIPIPQKAYPY